MRVRGDGNVRVGDGVGVVRMSEGHEYVSC